MLTRTQFLQITGSTAVLSGMPAALRAATPFHVDSEYRYSDAGVLRSVTFDRASDRDRVQIVFAALFADRVKAAIVPGSDQAIRGLQLWQVADRTNAIVAINGGFFQMNSIAYDGLLVVDGKQVTRKNSDYSGAVVIDAGGTLSLQRIDALTNPAYAMQTGPFFIDPGGTNGMRSKTYDQATRSFIAQRGKIIVTGITSAVSLSQLADVLLQFPGAFLVDRFDSALNLSGAASSAFFARVPHDDVREGGRLNSPAILTFSLRK